MTSSLCCISKVNATVLWLTIETYTDEMTRLFPFALQECSEQVLKVLCSPVYNNVVDSLVHGRSSPLPTHSVHHIVTSSVLSTVV